MMKRALVATLMCFVAVRHGSMQTRNATDGPWSGWVRCELTAQLNENGRSYVNQQTHTWALTAATPASGTDIKEYPATWTVDGGGTGQRQEGNGRTVGLAALAHECGYTDQAHLNREFRRFSNRTPRQFVTDLLATHELLRGAGVAFVQDN